MSKLKQAEELYLRGFGSEYIKRRTGISMQSLLKQLRAAGIVHTKDEIVQNQIRYIRDRYSVEEIEAAYETASSKYADMFKSCRGRHVEILGCAFGKIAPVMTALLGKDRYGCLKSRCWKAKQTVTMMTKYGVRNVFQKEVFGQFVTDEAIVDGRKRREETLMQRYGVASPNANPEICARMMQSAKATNLKRYGVEYPTQRPNVARLVSEHRQATMEKVYGVKNSVESDEIRNRIFDTRRANGTCNSSMPEDVLFGLLVDIYGSDDVLRNVVVDSRYPFHVDFYIKSRDLFIELNGDVAHGGRWYNADSERDCQRVKAWLQNAERLESVSGKKSRYRNYVKVWTVTDVAKRSAARMAGLNYLVFWDGNNNGGTPKLSDAKAWIEDGMPYPWKSENMV